MRIAEVLRAWRFKHELTLKDAAQSIGIPFQTYHRIEQGQQQIDGRTLVTLLLWLFGA